MNKTVKQLIYIVIFIVAIAAYWVIDEQWEYYKMTRPSQMERATMSILSHDKKTELRLNFPKCFYDDVEQLDKPRHWMRLKHPKATFTGNIHGQYVCLKGKQGILTTLKILQAPSTNIGVPYAKNSNEYWIAFLENGKKDKYFLGKKNNLYLYKSGVSSHAILIDDKFPNKKHNLFIDFVRYTDFSKGHVDGFTNSFEITTFLNEKFQVNYTVYSSRLLKHDDPAFTVKVDSQFVDDFVEVIQSQGNVLDHPEIIEKFIENNERVIAYIKANSQEIEK